MQLNNLCGIDVGCTNIKMVAMVHGTPVYKTIPSGDSLKREELLNAISSFYLSFGINFKGLGIAFSGCTIDGLSVYNTPLNCLKNLCVSDFSHLNCPVRLINDSNATALAGTIEYPNSKVLLAITNGTSIGCGITINGKLFTGANGFAGEVYGNPVLLAGEKFSKIGKLCSGSKILNKINNLSDEVAKECIIKEASQHFGSLLVSLIHFFNPDTIYFSGGGFEFPGFIDLICDFAYKHAYKHFLTNLKFTKASIYSGCIGAMKFVVE